MEKTSKLLSELTLEEKAALVSGTDFMHVIILQLNYDISHKNWGVAKR